MMLKNCNVDSPTPMVEILFDSINDIFISGKCFDNIAAVIHPAEPPPTIVIEFTFIYFSILSYILLYHLS